MKILNCLPILLILSLWAGWASGNAIQESSSGVLKLTFNDNNYLLETWETSSKESQQGFTRNSEMDSISDKIRFTSVSVVVFQSSTLTIQARIDFDPSTNIVNISNVTITTTYNSKNYTLQLNKTSFKTYMNQNGLE